MPLPKRISKILSSFCCLILAASLIPFSVAAETGDDGHAEASMMATAMFGTPQLGSNDKLWALTSAYPINKSTLPDDPDDPRPRATGTVRILWDYDYVYARVEVVDEDVYVGPGADHTYDSVEFFVGPGSSGSNQWRVSATGVLSGQSYAGRAAWTEITETGYIVEMRIPKRDLHLQAGQKLTFEVNINNSTKMGGDRYEVVSAFGDPDTGFVSDESFRDIVLLVPADFPDTRLSIFLSVDPGGTITPYAAGSVLRAVYGSDITFEIFPDYGKIVDTVTVDGEEVEVSSDNTFSLTNIVTDHRIHVTFKDDPEAEPLSFIVWNDNFARGEYTTAVIIDLGEGREALGSALHPGLFTVSARDTNLTGDAVVFEGRRKISRVYANDEPNVRGYLGKVHPSPDYRDGLPSGRYIVVEFEFYDETGGRTTLDGNSNSTRQNYYIVQNDDIVLTEGEPIRYAVFRQESVVNPILDQFETHNHGSLNYALYLHKNEEGEVVKGLPLYVYTHGFSRGGTQAHVDQKASMKSANGSVALMKKMEEDPEKYASHILNISYSGGFTPSVEDVKEVIDGLIADGLVDPNRIYASGFSMGGWYTNTLVTTYPGFFAAAAPMGIASGWPLANENEAHKDLAYWIFVNKYDTRVGASNLDNFANDIVHMNNARASRFESNEALTWPYIQYDQPSQRPDPASKPPLLDYIAHEVEAAVLYNRITMENPHTRETWSIAPIMQSPDLPAWNDDYTDVFDWMFSQRKPGVPDAPGNLTATPGDRRVTLNWTAPAHDGGKEILGYKVWHDDEAPVTVSAAVYEYTFTGLTNGQAYTFHVVAFNEKGDSAPASVKATPRRSSSGGGSGGGGSDTTGDTGTDREEKPSQPAYTLITPEDRPAVTDEDGNTTLPGGGVIVLADGTRIEAPAGTTIDAGGKVTIGSDGATVRFGSGFSLDIRGGTALLLDGEAPLGFTVASGHPYRDVGEYAWFSRFVTAAHAFGLFDGTSAATFSPGLPMTRAMLVQVLANLENADRSRYTNSRFRDVPAGQWYTAAVEWAAENGIVSGTGADRFDPDAPLTREQLAVILYNYLNSKGYQIPPGEVPSFADEGEISPWALEAVRALRGLGMVAGKGGNVFDPKGTATRAEIATVFVKLIEYLAKAEA